MTIFLTIISVALWLFAIFSAALFGVSAEKGDVGAAKFGFWSAFVFFVLALAVQVAA